MRFTVDASVVVKWFVSEELTENATLLRSHRLELHAPDLVFAEFANACWKKFRRGEITDIRQRLRAIERLPQRITMHSLGNLAFRGAEISLALDHPVYDCLYLACAEATASQLVTADHRFVNKVRARAPGLPVRYLGDEDFAADIGAAAVAPVIARATVAELADAYDLLSATGEQAASLARNRLGARLDALSPEERIDLLALARFGQPGEPDWTFCHEAACSEVAGADAAYLIHGGAFWRRGMERLFDAIP